MTYSVPNSVATKVMLGSLVRVPLRNRRVRGWVVGLRHEDGGSGLSEILAVSGRGPVFDACTLEAMRAVARQTVRPLRELLKITTPERIGRGAAVPSDRGARRTIPRRTYLRFGAASNPLDSYSPLIEEVLDAGGSAVVCVPEVHEGSALLNGLASRFSTASALVHSSLDPAERSRSLWDASFGLRRLVLGGRAAALAPSRDLALIVVHREGDRSFKEQRAPYYDARRVAVERARSCGASVVFGGWSPSLWAAHSLQDWEWLAPENDGKSSWPLVELVEPARAMVPRRAIAAIIEARRRRSRTLILLPRVESTAMGPGPEKIIPYLERVVPGARIARADRSAILEKGSEDSLSADVVVGTTAALLEARSSTFGLTIALGLDAHLMTPSMRAIEEAYQELWQAGLATIGRSGGGRLILETSSAEHHLFQALARGDPVYFVEKELSLRRAGSLPPFVQVIRLRSEAAVLEEAARKSTEAGAQVLGPIEGEKGYELILKAADPGPVLALLSTMAEQSKLSFGVEVDPRDW